MGGNRRSPRQGKGPWVIQMAGTSKLAGSFFVGTTMGFRHWTGSAREAKQFRTKFDAGFEARHHLGLRHFDAVPLSELVAA